MCFSRRTIRVTVFCFLYVFEIHAQVALYKSLHLKWGDFFVTKWMSELEKMGIDMCIISFVVGRLGNARQ